MALAKAIPALGDGGFGFNRASMFKSYLAVS